MKIIFVIIILTAFIVSCAPLSHEYKSYTGEVSKMSCSELDTEKRFLEKMHQNMLEQSQHINPLKSAGAGLLSLGTHTVGSNISLSEGRNIANRETKIQEDIENIRIYYEENC